MVWNSELNEFIDGRHAHLAAILHDYKPTLSLVYIPRKKRDETDTKPWAILESPPNRPAYIVRYLSDQDMERPDLVLSWVFEGDLDKHRPNDVLAKIEARENAARLIELRIQEEERQDAQDLIAFSARTPKHSWAHNGRRYSS